jgi:hypothetical protein
MSNEVFWVVTPCNIVGGYQRFGGTYLRTDSNPEDRGERVLRNAGNNVPDHTTSQPRRPQLILFQFFYNVLRFVRS